MDIGLIIYGSIMALGLLGICSRWIPGMKTDNIIEEAAETIIKVKTGITVDLSPDTPDPDIPEVRR